MSYVALDGCRTSKTTDMLSAYIGQSRKNPKLTFRENGWDPRFAWGWKDAKGIAFEQQGVLYDKHFEFVGDYYWHLTQRDPWNGYMLHTYEEAVAFGQHPNGASPYNPSRIDNSEGDSINYVGCYDCFFDE